MTTKFSNVKIIICWENTYLQEVIDRVLQKMKGRVLRMKRLTVFLCFILSLFILTGCADNSDEESTTDSTENNSTEENTDKNTSTSALEDGDVDEANNITSEASTNTNSESTAAEGSNSSEEDEKEEILSAYSSEQIEYARIWSQHGPNQELDTLYVLHISAGEQINPNDDTSASYPEDVIQLAGSRLVDGSVTYSGNGDGTINVYNVPLRWENNVPEDLDENFMSDYTQSIIDETESVYIEPESNQKIIDLIEKIEIHN